MKRLIVIISMLLLYSTILFGKEYVWLVGGAQTGRLTGKGSGDNEFKYGYGFFAELGIIFNNEWAWLMYGTRCYWSENEARDHSVKGRFYMPYYTEMRKYGLNKNFLGLKHNPFLSFGFGWDRMHFDKSKGADNQYVWSVGLGTKIITKKGDPNNCIQFHFKPYIVSGNSLGQDRGIEITVGYGFFGE